MGLFKQIAPPYGQKVKDWSPHVYIFLRMVTWLDQKRTQVRVSELAEETFLEKEIVINFMPYLVTRNLVTITTQENLGNDDFEFEYTIPPEARKEARQFVTCYREHLKSRVRKEAEKAEKLDRLPRITFEAAAEHLKEGRKLSGKLEHPGMVEHLCRCVARLGMDTVSEIVDQVAELPTDQREEEFFNLYTKRRDELYPPQS